MINFSCEQCGKQHQTSKEFEGKQVRCRKCRATIQIPLIHEVKDSDLLPQRDSNGIKSPRKKQKSSPKRKLKNNRAALQRNVFQDNNTSILKPKPVHPALSGRLSFWPLLQALKKRWLPASVVGLLCAGAVVGAMLYFAPAPKQIGRSYLQISSTPNQVIFQNHGSKNFELYRRSQIALIKSRFVLNAALRNPKVSNLACIKEQTDPLRWLEQEIRTDFPLGPEIIRVSMEGKNTTELKTLVDTVVKTYLDEFANKEHNKLQEQLEQLKRLGTKYEERVQGKKQQLRDLAKAAEAGNADIMKLQQQIAILQLADAKKELANLQSEVRRLHVKIDIQLALQYGFWTEYVGMLFMLPTDVSPIGSTIAGLLHSKNLQTPIRPRNLDPAVAEFLNRSPEVVDFRQRILNQENLIKSVKATMGPESSPDELKKAKLRLEEIKGEFEKRKKELKGQIKQDVREQMNIKAKMDLVSLQRQKLHFQGLEDRLKADVARYVRESKLWVEKALDLDAIHDDLKRWEKVSESITQRIEALEIEKLAPKRVTLLEDTVVYNTESKKAFLMSGFAGIGTLGFILFCFAWWEFRSRRIYSSHEVVHGLGINLVGTLPDSTQYPRDEKNSKYSAQAEQILIDSVDAIRTMILSNARSEEMKVLMVTSAMAGEGKTTSASHLAASLGRVGYKTLLIDCDLRKPNLHRLFQIPVSPGLSEFLRGEKEIVDCVTDTGIADLYILPTGKSDVISITSLSKPIVGELLDKLRNEFDFVIVDSSPVLPVPDASILSKHVDGVVFSVLRDVSQLPKVYFAYQRLTDMGATIIGAIVNGSREDAYATGYYYQSTVETSSN